jgi:putative inorganic carbon (hco3(-)) transporter
MQLPHKPSNAARLAITFLDRWHWVWLILAAPLLLFPSPNRSPALFVLPLIWSIAWLVRPRSPLPSTPLNAIWLLLLLMLLVSVIVTPDLAFSLPKVAGVILGAGVFFAVAREGQSPRGLRLSLLLLITFGVGIAALGLIGMHWNNKFSALAQVTDRLPIQFQGLPGAELGLDANEVAGALLWVLPVSMSLLIGLIANALRPDPIPSTHRLIPALHVMGLLRYTALCLYIAFATLFISGVLILTQSRGSYIALALTLPLVLLFALVIPARSRPFVIGFMVFALIIVSILIWRAGPDLVMQRIAKAYADISVSTDVVSKVEVRLETWSRAIYGIQEYPFTGMGMNIFRQLAPSFYPSLLLFPDFDIAHAHNEFLQAALDLGLPGMVAFAGLYLAALWMLRHIWLLSTGDLLCKSLALGLGGGLFAHFVFGLADAVALGAKPGFLFWMLLGLICGLFTQRRII